MKRKILLLLIAVTISFSNIAYATNETEMQTEELSEEEYKEKCK